MYLRKLILTFLFATAGFFAFAQNVTTTIKITNARQTSYTKDEVTGNDIIVLEGSVELSVQNGNNTSEIKADKISYDRKTEILFAEGNVEITTKSSSSGGETTTANSLLLNTSTLEGVFDGGRVVQTQTDAINLPSGSTLIVFSDVFGKGENNTIAFKNSSLTFCDEEVPHWHIDATRTWLLPGGEFAFFNALLYVGVVPVFYFPAFYYPKDELVFNPVFSTRRREGFSIQTTTYLYGRKPLESSNNSSSSDSSDTSTESLKALYNFMKPSSLKQQKLEGLVLHNLDEDYTGNTSQYAKFMADWYSRLGYMVGFDGNFTPSQKFITSLNFGAYFGFSNTLFDNGGKYTAYDPIDGLMIKDESYFMGKRMPFRYGLKLGMTLSKPFKINFTFPLYSDPFFAYDFLDNRSETMDWISYLLEQTSQNEETISVTEVSSYSWKINSSYSPPVPSILQPYVSNVSLSLNSSVDISSKFSTGLKDSELALEKSKNWVTNTPLRKFYYPSGVTPASASVSLNGTLFQWPLPNRSNSGASKLEKKAFLYDLNKPDELKSEKEKQQELEAKLAEEAGENSEENKLAVAEDAAGGEEKNLLEPQLPLLDYSVSSVSEVVPVSYKLGYNLNSSVSTQLTYSSEELTTPDDFNWKTIKSSQYTIKMPLSLSSNFNYYGNYFNMNNTVSYNPVWQKHPNTDGYTDSEKLNLILADYKAESQTVSNTNTISYKPFIYTEHFADTGLSWNSTIKLYQRKFIGDAENPDWEDVFADWKDNESVTVNSLNFTYGMSQMNSKFKESLVLSAVLPPLLKQYSATLNFNVPYTSFSFSTSISETQKDQPVAEWKKNPLQQSLSFSKILLGSSLSFTESYNYSIEEKKSDSLKLNLSWYSFSSAFICSNTAGADYMGPEDGWVINDDKNFRPYSLSFNYSLKPKTFYTWFNRITFSPSLSTSLTADLIRPTNSYFVFNPGVTFKITDFFYLTFSSSSKNSVMYRYIQKMLGYDGLIPGEQNIFKDLLNSYAFGNVDLRKASGFKLKSLNMSMTHELHDWKFNMTMKIEPRLVTEGSSKYYDFSPYITIGVVWNPMESMKTQIVDEYGEWHLD